VILVAGDAMRDIYWHGEVTRISPEAPVPVISVKRVEEREGAAANVAANVEALGVKCEPHFGGPMRQVIRKIRLMVKGRQEYRVDFDYPQHPIPRLDFSEAKVVIFVDYGKGTLGNVQSLIQEAKSAGATVLVDPKGYDYSKYRGADVVKPNLDEMKVMVGGWKDEHDLTLKAQDIRLKANIGALLLTRASEGMTLYTHKGAFHLPAEAKDVVDVTGAGETAIATLGVSLHNGYSLEESVKYANKAAGIVVGRFGPSVAKKEEVFCA
jgi:D-glycero-beta-D-manno-heptose-7-phosphate kinase